MNNENKTIHDFDLSLISEYFSKVERQGPGSPAMTVKALSFIDNLPERANIADLGCGTGGQTMTLAQNVQGQITGLDFFPDFIDIFNKNAAQFGLHNRVQGIVGSMDALPFEAESLDLIWSEGAIYNIGFERGLREWSRYLKAGGYVAVTEASWFTTERPDEIQAFWDLHYPEIDTIAACVERMQNTGYVPIAVFPIDENCWTEHYFAPCRKIQSSFLEKHNDNPVAEELIAGQRHEMEMYDKYKAFYGYVFYIGKKI